MNKYIKKIIELPENILFDIENLISNIKNNAIFAYQRLVRGYDDRWKWSIKDELTPILIDCLNFYKKQEEYPCNFKDKEEWNKAIDDMLAGFKAGRDLDYVIYKEFKSDDELVKEYNRLRKIKDKGMKLFSKHYSDLWS